MELTKSVLSYETVDSAVNPLPVIIVAAGSSTRMNGVNKQFLAINNVPVIIKTILKFESSNYIKNIIVVTKKDDILSLQKLLEDYKITKVSDIVEGGSNRTESVKNGINALDRCERKVLIHDGARPFVTEKMIKDVCVALKTADCAVLANKVVDTVKQTDGENMIINTLDRNFVFLAQTPQGVNVSKYRFALNSLDIENYTDDSSLMEAMGYKSVICESNWRNIKITVLEDIPIAQVLAKIEEEEKCE